MRLSCFILVSLVLGLAGLRASAADLLPPAPVIDDSDEPAASGWYLRGGIGAAEALASHRNGDAVFDLVPPLARARFDRGFTLDAGAGYRFAPWFRADVTVDRRFGGSLRGMRLGADAAQGFDRADFAATTVLANAYLDLPVGFGLTPYVGAGLGAGWNRLDGGERWIGGTATGTASGTGTLSSRTDTAPAWALMGGVALDLTERVEVDLGYRYSRLGRAATRFDGAGPALRVDEVEQHELRLGVRYLFD